MSDNRTVRELRDELKYQAAQIRGLEKRLNVLLPVYWAAAALKIAPMDYCDGRGQDCLEKAVSAARKVLDKKSSKKGGKS